MRHNFNRYGNSMIINYNSNGYGRDDRNFNRFLVNMFGNNFPEIGSPVALNTSNKAKYEKEMINRLNNMRKRPQNLPKHDIKNVSNWYAKNFNVSRPNNIKKDKRVYIKPDVRNGKVKQVYNQDDIIRLLLMSRNRKAKSPITRKIFTINDVVPYYV